MQSKSSLRAVRSGDASRAARTLLLAVCVVGACHDRPPVAPQPRPVILHLFPSSITAQARDFTLLVETLGADTQSVVYWNGQPRPTLVGGEVSDGFGVRSRFMQIDLTPADVARAGTAQVSVTTGAGAASDPVAFRIDPAFPPPTGFPDGAIASGTDFSCALTVDGLAYCWGLNASGQLGDGTRIGRAVPAPVAGGLRYVALTAGSNYACGLAAAGTLYCWGAAPDATEPRTEPQAVPGGLAFTKMSASHHGGMCALTAAGEPYCWGLFNFGGTGGGPPQRMAGAPPLAAIAAADREVCGLTATGAEYCWYGGPPTLIARMPAVDQLSLSDAESWSVRWLARRIYYWRLGPNPAVSDMGEPVDTVVRIDAGASAICALSDSGGAHCWGTNGRGQLGLGELGGINDFGRVVGGLHFQAIAPGDDHTCAITRAGQIYCWGDRGYGQLGDGVPAVFEVPTPVADGRLYTAISHADRATCAAGTDGAAYCWGANDLGQMGDGTHWTRVVPTRVGGGLRFTSVAQGGRHGCGLTPEGTAYCWGADEWGQLGSGATPAERCDTIPCSTVPLAVAGGRVFASISASADHTCALTRSGAAYCWGAGSVGQLGDGTSANRPVPTAVAGGLSFTALRAGGSYTCGLTAGGEAYCWGDGRSRVLGTGDWAGRLTPAPVAGGHHFVELAVSPALLDLHADRGGYATLGHTCAIDDGAAVWCWGTWRTRDYGLTGSTTPIRAGGPGPYHAITAGTGGTCALDRTDLAHCWDDQDVAPLPGSVNLTALTGDRVFGCGLGLSGRAFCWGPGYDGVLGNAAMGYETAPVPASAPAIFGARSVSGVAVTVEKDPRPRGHGRNP